MDLNHRLVQWRRYLHQNPELSFQEFNTSEFIARQLKEMGIETQRISPTGVIGIVQGDKREGPTVALRADIDALPLIDDKDVPYRSKVQGVMHACGHDGHTAILLGVSQVLNQLKQHIGRVVLIFQPAEEQPPGGADKVIEQAFLDNAAWIFGLHLWAGLPSGYVGIKSGPLMANADEFSIRITGKGGHASMPQDTIDPVLIASQVVVALQSIVSRFIDPLEPAVVTVGSIHAGTGFNIIPQEAVLTGTYRSFSDSARNIIERRIADVTQGICSAYGAKCLVQCDRGYSALINPEQGAARLKEAAAKIVGKDRIVVPKPVLGGEDFSAYLKKVPGAFMFLGARSGKPYPHHHPRFDFDEGVMETGVKLLVQAVLDANN